MIKCLVVGSNSRKIADYIIKTSGGSVEIGDEHVYSSFFTDEEKLKNQIVIADIAIYYLDESISIRDDLRVLSDLIKDKTFFNVKEIFIFARETETIAKGIRQFMMLMDELEYDSYHIVTDDNDIPLTKIYNDINGISGTEDPGVYRKKVYRTVRDEESRVGYDPVLFKGRVLVQEDDRVVDYERMKQAAVKAETNRIIQENPELEPEKVNLDIKGVNIEDRVYKRNIIVVCGNPKSGTSVFASNMAMHLAKNKNKVSMIDISSNCGSARACLKKYKHSTLVDNEKLLTGTDYSNKNLAIYNTSSLHKRELRPSFLRYLLSIPNRTKSDYYVIDCDMTELREVIDLCGYRILRLFICAQEVKDEVLLVQGVVDDMVAKDISTMVFLNRSIAFDKSYKRVSAISAKELLNEKCKVIAYVDFDVDICDLGILLI